MGRQRPSLVEEKPGWLGTKTIGESTCTGDNGSILVMRRVFPAYQLLLTAVLLHGGACSVFFSSSGSEKEGNDAGPGNTIDAGDAVCGEACAAVGGECGLGGRCSVECLEGEPCECPPGHDCLLEVAPGAQDLQIDCKNAVGCEIRCTGNGSCNESTIECGIDCRVLCMTDFSCTLTTVFCGSGACEMDCDLFHFACANSNLRCGNADSCSLDCRSDSCHNFTVDCETASACAVTCDEPSTYGCAGAEFDCAETPPESCNLQCNGTESFCE